MDKRFLSGALAGALGGIIALACAGERPQGEASSLTLKDHGRTFAKLSSSGKDQSSTLAFFDQKAGSRLELGVDADGRPLIRLLSAQGAPKLTFKVLGANQSGTVVFQDSKGRERLRLGLDPEGAGEDPYFYYVDRTGARQRVFGNF